MSKDTGNRRAREREESRSRIVEAATRIIAEKGMDALSFGDLAKEAGVSRPLIYFHFKDRTQLFLEAVVRANQMLHANFVSAISAQGSGLDQLVAIGRAYVAFFRDNPREFALMCSYSPKQVEGRELDAIEEQLSWHEAAILELMTTVIKRGMRDKSLRPDLGDPMKTALCLWSFAHGLLHASSNLSSDAAYLPKIESGDFIEHGFALLTQSIRKLDR